MALQVGDPSLAGLDAGRLARVSEILREGYQKELYPGGVVWVCRKGVDALVDAVGHTDFSRETPVDEDTLFDLASVTKPVATATAMLLLAQDGCLHFGQTVGDFFPERSLPHLANVTLRHLLTHTSGLPAWKDLYSKGQTREQAIDELFRIPLIHDPGTTHVYSCMGYIMLSLVVQAASGQPIDVFCKNRIFDPLRMTDTMFNPPTNAGRAIAATDHCPMRKRKLVGEVHDGNAYVLGGVSGNAGLFSTAKDLARFCHSITFPSPSDQALSLAPSVAARMFANAIPEHIGGQSIGWFMSPNEMMPGGDFVSKAAIGHTGFTGTAIIVDPDYSLFCILLTNRVCRDDDGALFRHLRRRLFNAVMGAIVW